ncbi:MAG: helix-turn-helix domain-containing protein [Bacteroidales bacterium]|nr:helix-turn-helix domain-containing protein [Bacteroidales bacterium]
MDFLTDLTDIRTIQWLACTDSCVLAFILMLIKVPATEYSKNITNAKTTIAVSFIVCAFMMVFTLNKYSEVWEYERFSSLTMLIAVSFSSLAMSYSMINLLDDKMISSNTFIVNIFLITSSSILLLEMATGTEKILYHISLAASLLLFASQSIFYIIMFDKAYKKSQKALNAYYDDEEEHKIRWIRFCYIIAMLTDLCLLVYMMIPTSFMKIYIAWYVLFMLYFTANFISFIGSHKMILDAFAHKTLSRQNLFPPKNKREKALKEDTEYDRKQMEKAFKAIQKNLAQWVADKKYREYDKSREEIAAELDTTKELLQLYFMTNIGQDFRSWRTELRINDAKRMLLEDKGTSIQLVGELCGFSDRSNFHTQFTRLTGCSPKKWRETGGKGII